MEQQESRTIAQTVSYSFATAVDTAIGSGI